MRQVSRICDMRDGFKLRLFIQDDGDVIVSVLPEEHKHTFDGVEFCASGTQSPRTHEALHELYKAMILDEIECEQSA